MTQDNSIEFVLISLTTIQMYCFPAELSPIPILRRLSFGIPDKNLLPSE